MEREGESEDASERPFETHSLIAFYLLCITFILLITHVVRSAPVDERVDGGWMSCLGWKWMWK